MNPCQLTIISHYYNNHSFVIDQLEYWSRYRGLLRSAINFILVDDCSSDKFDDELIAGYREKLNLRLFRVTDDIAWNQGGARNLGIFCSVTEWIILIDIDQLLYESFLVDIVDGIQRGIFEPEVLYHFRIKELVNIQNNESLIHHPNSYLVNRSKFLEFGMYDEDFVGGYGYEDVYLMKQWVYHGMRRSLIDKVSSEDLPFGTKSLDRDLSRNLKLAMDKINSGEIVRSRGILRFNWKAVF